MEYHGGDVVVNFKLKGQFSTAAPLFNKRSVRRLFLPVYLDIAYRVNFYHQKTIHDEITSWPPVY